MSSLAMKHSSHGRQYRQVRSTLALSKFSGNPLPFFQWLRNGFMYSGRFSKHTWHIMQSTQCRSRREAKKGVVRICSLRWSELLHSTFHMLTVLRERARLHWSRIYRLLTTSIEITNSSTSFSFTSENDAEFMRSISPSSFTRHRF